jgi:hypothetical protein
MNLIQLPYDILHGIAGDFYETKNGLTIIHSNDDGKQHISISHRKRLPTYQEMKELRYQLCPEIKYMAEIFPPENEFVNIQKNTRHLWEIDV